MMRHRALILLAGLAAAAGCADHELATRAGPAGAVERWWSSDKPVAPSKPRPAAAAGKRTASDEDFFESRWNSNFY